jgi:hypothetical protein
MTGRSQLTADRSPARANSRALPWKATWMLSGECDRNGKFRQTVPQRPTRFDRKGQFVSQDINVVALIKGKERYIFLFDDAHKAEALRTLGRFASNPELSFTWFDAAVLSHKIRHAFPDDATTASRVNLRCAPDIVTDEE